MKKIFLYVIIFLLVFSLNGMVFASGNYYDETVLMDSEKAEVSFDSDVVSTESKAIIKSNTNCSDLNMFAAAYLDNKLVALKKIDLDLTEGPNEINTGIDWSDVDKDMVKLFVWNEDATPYAKYEYEVPEKIESSDSEATEISLADIEKISVTPSVVTFTYINENGERTEASFSKDATVIYNGKNVPEHDISANLLMADSGSIKIDENGSVVIKAYRTLVVSSVDCEQETIYDQYGVYDRILRLSGTDYSFTNADGSKALLEDIVLNDVISVATSLDRQKIEAIICREKVQGTIDKLEEADALSDTVATIGGKEYTFENTTIPETVNEKYWTDYIKLGANATYLLDAFGNIVSVIEVQTNGVAGYIVGMEYINGSDPTQGLQAAIMVKGHKKYQNYDLASSVEIDGKKIESSDKICAMFLDSNGNFAETAVLFELDTDGKISTIDTPRLNAEDEDDSLILRYTADDAALRYKKATFKLGDMYFWNPAVALTVLIPSDAESYADYISYDAPMANDAKYNVDLYTVGTSNPEAAIVVGKDLLLGNTTTTLTVVDHVEKVYDSKGNEVEMLYYWGIPDEIASAVIPQSGEMSNAVKELESGDIVRISKNYDNEIVGFRKFYDYSTKQLLGVPTGSFNSEYRVVGGYTTKIEGNYVCLTPGAPESTYEDLIWFDHTKLNRFLRYKVGESGVEIIPATLTDIRTYEDVPYNPTGIIQHLQYEIPVGNAFLVEMPQPEGTGFCTVTYECGAEDSSIVAIPPSIRCDAGDVITLPMVPSRKDYIFAGWNIDGLMYQQGESYTVTGNTIATAQWFYSPTYDFYFVDASGEAESIVMCWSLYGLDGSPIAHVIPDASVFTKEGYELIGWTDSSGTVYLPGQMYTPETPGETFTAIWMQKWSGSEATDAPTMNSSGYYEIYNGEDLAWFAQLVNGGETTANAILMNDIYLNNFLGDDRKPISVTGWYNNPENVAGAKKWDSYMINTYSGIFDGNGKSIYGLYMAPSSNQGTYTGMFKQVDGATIKNLNLTESYFVSNVTSASSKYTGLLIGGMTGNASTIENVDIIGGKFTAKANATIHSFGSIAGVINTPSGETKVTNCDSSITIDTTGAASYTLTATNGGIGAIVGKARGASGKAIVIDNCSFTGYINVPGTSYVGAIIGRGADGASAGAHVTIKNCSGASTASAATTVRDGDDCIYGIAKNATIDSSNSVSCTKLSE